MKIIVASLPFNVNEEDLRNAFTKYGTVKTIEIVGVHLSSRSIGYAIVEMPEEAEAQAAMKELNGGQVNGRTIVISEAKEFHTHFSSAAG